MLATIIKFAASLVSKELLKAAIREIAVEFALELLEEFVKRTDNQYDDKLVAKFKEFVEKYFAVG